jgi:hypothetical protein
VSWPVPQPGLVIRYSYLWNREALAGQEEGVKDRPCAVVVALQHEEGATWVYVLPITHARPSDAGNAIEIPAVVKARIGLDGERSWVVVGEANVFAWPGPDLRMLPGQGAESSAYGFLPPAFFRVVRDRFLAADSRKKAALVKRTE